MFCKWYDLVDWICGPVSNGDFCSADILWLGHASAPGCPLRHGDIAVQIHADEEVIELASGELACRQSAQSRPCQRDYNYSPSFRLAHRGAGAGGGGG